MTGNLLVTPEELIRISDEFSTANTQVKTITTQMLEIVRGLTSTWQGEANAAYTGKFNQLEDDMEKIYRMINEHVVDLQEMANNYIAAEQTNVENSNALAGDIIS